jgi:uncharacterized protein (DUF952 family)
LPASSKTAKANIMQNASVYKLLTEDDWCAAEAVGHTSSAIDVADGYVHLSTRAQLPETAARHFAGKGRVKLLKFDSVALPPLKWEPSRGGDLFPHLYAPLEIARAQAAWWLEPGPDGALLLPEDI